MLAQYQNEEVPGMLMTMHLAVVNLLRTPRAYETA